MSIPLVDFRGKVTAETHAVLEAESRHSGRDMSEIVREIMHKWAVEHINRARLLDRSLTVAGFEGIIAERRAKPNE